MKKAKLMTLLAALTLLSGATPANAASTPAAKYFVVTVNPDRPREISIVVGKDYLTTLSFVDDSVTEIYGADNTLFSIDQTAGNHDLLLRGLKPTGQSDMHIYTESGTKYIVLIKAGKVSGPVTYEVRRAGNELSGTGAPSPAVTSAPSSRAVAVTSPLNTPVSSMPALPISTTMPATPVIASPALQPVTPSAAASNLQQAVSLLQQKSTSQAAAPIVNVDEGTATNPKFSTQALRTADGRLTVSYDFSNGLGRSFNFDPRDIIVKAGGVPVAFDLSRRGGRDASSIAAGASEQGVIDIDVASAAKGVDITWIIKDDVNHEYQRTYPATGN